LWMCLCIYVWIMIKPKLIESKSMKQCGK
jgi:hypothetical protein